MSKAEKKIGNLAKYFRLFSLTQGNSHSLCLYYARGNLAKNILVSGRRRVINKKCYFDF